MGRNNLFNIQKNIICVCLSCKWSNSYIHEEITNKEEDFSEWKLRNKKKGLNEEENM